MIISMRSGVTTPYESGRSLDHILEFARRVSGPAVQEITEENFEKFKKDNIVAFVLVGGSSLASVRNLIPRLFGANY